MSQRNSTSTNLASLKPARLAFVVAAAFGCFSIGHAQEAAIPPAPAPIVTAPSLKQNLLVPQVQPTGQPAVQDAASPAGSQGDDAPWVLNSETHPYPLRFTAALPASALYLDIPTEQEARLMLPGRSADMADRARASISKYLTDAIGVAAQARGRQADAFENWLGMTERQFRLLSPDPWQQYQFNIEITREVTKFRDEVAGQSQPSVVRMASEIKTVISKISPIINLMPTYDLRTAWYNLMVQMKEGLMLYQAQANTGDSQLLARLDEFLKKHPPVPRPAGNPPPKNQPPKPVEAPPQTLPSSAAVQPALKEAPKPAQQESSSTVGGLIVVGGLFAVVGGLFLKLRRRKSVPGTVEKTT